jgi:5'-nucleotidase
MGDANRYAQLRLLAITDLHGHLADRATPYTDPWTGSTGTVGGIASLAAHLRGARTRSTVLLHCGDMIGASPPESGLLADEPTIEALNRLDLLAGIPGNHEFDRGPAHLRRLAGKLNFPLLAANLNTFEPTRTIRLAGVPITFIGAALSLTPHLSASSATEGLTFEREATALRRHHPPGIRIALIHEGGHQHTPTAPITGRITGIVAATPHIDLYLAGHTHFPHVGHVDHRLVVQPAPFAHGYAQVDLHLDRDKGRLHRVEAALHPNWRTAGAPDLAAIVARAVAETSAQTDQILAESAVPLPSWRDGAGPGDTGLGNLLADAYKTQAGTQLAFVNPGSIRAGLPAGPIRYGDLYRVQPLGNQLMALTLTGSDIQQILQQQQTTNFERTLEIAGLSYTHTPTRIHRIEGIRPEDTYTVAASSYLAEGGDHYTAFRNATRKRQVAPELEALAAYLRALPRPFTIGPEGRIRARR